MLVTPSCFSCVIHDLNGAMDLLDVDEEKSFEIVDQTTKLFEGGMDRTKVPSHYITEVHRIVKNVTGIKIPFKELREKCNEIGMMLAERVKERIKTMTPEERFKYLIQWSIASNHIDFRTVGTGYALEVADQVEETLIQQVETGLHIDQTKEILELIKGAKSFLFIHDNVGEIVLDKLLIEEIQNYVDTVTSVLRGGPITSDATMEDGEAIGMAEVATDVICAGPDTLGISLDEMSEELKQAFEEKDLVLVKGQANYYVFSEYVKSYNKPIISLLSTKCMPVSNRLGYNKIINVAQILKK